MVRNIAGAVELYSLSHNDLHIGLIIPTDYDGPDIHLIGEVLLSRIVSFAFDIHVILTEGSLLISYALAGGQAWADLFSVR